VTFVYTTAHSNVASLGLCDNIHPIISGQLAGHSSNRVATCKPCETGLYWVTDVMKFCWFCTFWCVYLWCR